ncbi:hypothetical protein [Kitasatospora sp. NBC_01302]|uniref:hypothetical protein n=1 Tax=Kitasatospora sp. NBC_01302 TaxID=2903575 RepID=UPI002E157F3E|nr:hypothetical protein OG294_13825 [Kitasatospora sp. NBC_01302]
MITSSVIARSSTHKVELAITGAAPVTAEAPYGGEESFAVTGVRITYVDGKVTAIRYCTTTEDLFVAPEYLGQPELWPSWLPDLVEQYRPADAALPGCPQCDAPAVGDRIPTHTPRCPWNNPNF